MLNNKDTRTMSKMPLVLNLISSKKDFSAPDELFYLAQKPVM